MNTAVPSIEQLKELGLPTPVSYTPQTWGWWVLLAVLVGAVLLVGARRYWQWRRDRYRREALVRLAELQSSDDQLNALRELPELLKRVALSMPRLIPDAQLQCRSWRSLRSFGGFKTAENQDQEIAAFGSSYRWAVAAWGGEEWQAFLVRHSEQPLPADFSQQLAQLAYAPDAALLALKTEQRQQLFDTCKCWVERHHVAA
jgi:hypothetical protein